MRQLVIMAVSALLLLPLTFLWLFNNLGAETSKAEKTRAKRWDAHNPEEWMLHAFKIKTSYDTNVWLQYTSYLANETNRTDCYVCTRLPAATRQPRVRPVPFPDAH